MENQLLKDTLNSDSAPDDISPWETAQRNYISTSSFNHCMCSCLTHWRNHINQQQLSKEEKKALADALIHLVTQGFSSLLRLLLWMVHIMLKHWEKISQSLMRKNWLFCFIKRHSDKLSSVTIATLSVTGDKDIGIGTMQWRLDTLGRHWIDR